MFPKQEMPLVFRAELNKSSERWMEDGWILSQRPDTLSPVQRRGILNLCKVLGRRMSVEENCSDMSVRTDI